MCVCVCERERITKREFVCVRCEREINVLVCVVCPRERKRERNVFGQVMFALAIKGTPRASLKRVANEFWQKKKKNENFTFLDNFTLDFKNYFQKMFLIGSCRCCRLQLAISWTNT